MKKGLTNEQKLSDVVRAFESSDKEAGSYVALLAIGALVTKRGMLWSDVEVVITKTLRELYDN